MRCARRCAPVDVYDHVAVFELQATVVRRTHHQQAGVGAEVLTELRRHRHQLGRAEHTLAAHEQEIRHRRHGRHRNGACRGRDRHREETILQLLRDETGLHDLVVTPITQRDGIARLHVAHHSQQLLACRRLIVALERLAVDLRQHIAGLEAGAFRCSARAHADDFDAAALHVVVRAEVDTQNRARRTTAHRSAECPHVRHDIIGHRHAQVRDFAHSFVEPLAGVGQFALQLGLRLRVALRGFGVLRLVLLRGARGRRDRQQRSERQRSEHGLLAQQNVH